MSEQNDNSNNRSTWLIIGSVFVIALIIVVFYSLNFTNLLPDNGKYFLNYVLELSMDNGDWGTFGDYIGGTLNPIIAAAALYLIAKTYVLQKTETRKQIEIAAITALINAKLMKLDSLSNEIQEKDMLKTRDDYRADSSRFQGKLNERKDFMKELDNQIKNLEKDKEDLKKNINELQAKLNSYLI